ncbi:tetratricopeptide repeat protein [Granulicella arctica]|uniref:tetratricopeptide repeat protein n=1 Tax=Granulicella arctica TaxID=940613 RepID=UPI0021DF98AC|nr:tetratricopeptide repeat protein [Granulicella arctica]
MMIAGRVSLLAALLAGTMAAQTARSMMSAADAATLNKALAAYDSGNGAAAKPDLERLAARYPANFPANEALGILYVDAGEFARAVPFLEHAANAEKTNASAQANLGAAYIQVSDAKAAIQVLRRATTLDPHNGGVFSSLGHALFLDKQPAEAADAFAKAVALEPASVDDVYDWAVALNAAHKDAEAVAVLQRIPAGQRTDAEESLWGDAEERQGHFKEAVEHLQAAARLNPSEPNTYAVAIELLRHWSWEQAVEITRFGVKQFPESRRLAMANGIAYYGSGGYMEASAIFGGLLALDPTNENYGSLLGRSCSAAGGAAAPECQSLIAFAEKHPQNAQIDVSAAISLLHQPSAEQHLDQAQQMLEEAIRHDAKIPEAYYQLGVLQQQRLQWVESAASLKKAVELRPSFAEAHYRLARAYSHTGEGELARKEIALQQQYAQQEKDETNARLKEVTIFLTASH